MGTLLTQKTYYLTWIAGLLCLAMGIWKPEATADYQFHDTYIVVALLHLVGAVALLLFLLGLGYYMVIKIKGSVPLIPTLLQLLITFIFCYVILFALNKKGYEELSDIAVSDYTVQPQEILILFILMMLVYSITLSWALMRKQRID